MTPRTRTRLALAVAAALALLGTAGCGLAGKHAASRIPQYGVVDPGLPKELDLTALPPYMVEPPDEIEISARPSALDVAPTTLTVQGDGLIDLGFNGEVFVAGLTLDEVEQKVAQHLTEVAQRQKIPLTEPVVVSAKLVNGTQSKFYYVLGSVSTQGKVPSSGYDTVLEAILAAGLRSNSIPEKAYLVRPHPMGGRDQVFSIDWEGITKRGDTTTNYQVFPGDRIIVPGGKPPGLLSTLFGGG